MDRNKAFVGNGRPDPGSRKLLFINEKYCLLWFVRQMVSTYMLLYLEADCAISGITSVNVLACASQISP